MHTSIYPNPAKDILNIRSSQRIDAVDIFDVSGRLSAVYYGPATQLNISALTCVYYVKINMPTIYTLKLIKDNNAFSSAWQKLSQRKGYVFKNQDKNSGLTLKPVPEKILLCSI